MNKKIAFDNRLCYERDVLRQQAIHHHKLQTVLPTCHSPSKVYLDSSAPLRQPHLTTNRKKMQMEKERQLHIYTQNQRLASKMEHILNRQENAVLAADTPGSPPAVASPRGERTSPTKKPVHSPAYVHMPGIRLDSSQTPMVDCYLSPEYAMGRGNACKKDTLVNRGVQRQREQRIEDENRRMKERLQAQKPFYNTKKWDAEWKQIGAKFQHLHQDGTVGHLLPRTADGSSQTTSRSPLAAARRVKMRDGLPSLKPKTSHGGGSGAPPPPSRAGRLQQRIVARQNQPPSVDVLMIDHDDEPYGEPELVDCGPFVLLEATTRKGVEISVEELQIEMRDPASGAVQPGDLGLLVRGRWKNEVEGDCVIGLDVLNKVAQEIDDLEMMIKLETVSTLSGLGNFPRLSALVTEDELQRLLLKLVQVLNVQLLEDSHELVISSRLMRSPSPKCKDDRDRPSYRPRTCPTTLPSESHQPQDVGYDDHHGIDCFIVSEEETHQFQRVLCKQLAELLNAGRRRAGLSLPTASYCLAQYWFSASESALLVSALSTAGEAVSAAFEIDVEPSRVVWMLEQIQNEQARPGRVAWQFVLEWLGHHRGTG